MAFEILFLIYYFRVNLMSWHSQCVRAHSFTLKLYTTKRKKSLTGCRELKTKLLLTLQLNIHSIEMTRHLMHIINVMCIIQVQILHLIILVFLLSKYCNALFFV